MVAALQSREYQTYVDKLTKIDKSLKRIDTIMHRVTVPLEVLSICSVAYSIIFSTPSSALMSAACLGSVKLSQVALATCRSIQQKAFDDLLRSPPAILESLLHRGNAA